MLRYPIKESLLFPAFSKTLSMNQVEKDIRSAEHVKEDANDV